MARKKKELPILENVTITDVAAEGKALARVDDLVVFVPYVVPGDVVDLQVKRKKHHYAEAEAVRFHHYSEKRAEPFCEHFGVCGGCKWQCLPYEEQLRYKQQQVVDNLTRIGKVALPPHALPLTFIGGGLLWIGWFGFNAGSALTPDGISALAFANTVFGPVGAALSWSIGEYCLNGKVSSLGTISGVLAGLVAITPACAYVGPVGAVVIGALSGLACLWGVRGFKRLIKIDDSLDVFGIHGIGAIVGALLTGIFCSPSLGGTGFKGFHDDILSQFLGQLGSVVIAIIWSGVVALIAFKLAAWCCHGLRVELDDERMGLDLSYHGERSYTLN